MWHFNYFKLVSWSQQTFPLPPTPLPHTSIECSLEKSVYSADVVYSILWIAVRSSCLILFLRSSLSLWFSVYFCSISYWMERENLKSSTILWIYLFFISILSSFASCILTIWFFDSVYLGLLCLLHKLTLLSLYNIHLNSCNICSEIYFVCY